VADNLAQRNCGPARPALFSTAAGAARKGRNIGERRQAAGDGAANVDSGCGAFKRRICNGQASL